MMHPAAVLHSLKHKVLTLNKQITNVVKPKCDEFEKHTYRDALHVVQSML
jgi:hypothetical protein